jgi:hypothetical protein
MSLLHKAKIYFDQKDLDKKQVRISFSKKQRELISKVLNDFHYNQSVDNFYPVL